jgi:thymidylate synthase (FAD)
MTSLSDRHHEIAALRSEQNPTCRPVVAALEAKLYTPIPVLDHGFIRVIDYMGDDNAIVQAARVSYGKGTKKVNEDAGLIRYLMRHRHTTPFEMCEIKFHIKLPIFIARQWIRHRTANVNEYSARYSVLAKEFYIPDPQHLAPQSKANHQGRSELELAPHESQRVLQLLRQDAENCYDHYLEMMNDDGTGEVRNPDNSGLARELARMNLTLNYYTEWYWKIDLHNLLHFLSLRADSHAQYEIRAYAEPMLELVKSWAPIAYDAFMEYRVRGANLSGMGLKVVKAMLAGEKPTQENSGMSKREWTELMAILEINAG